MVRKFSGRSRRLLPATLAAGILVISGFLGATSASAKGVTTTGVTAGGVTVAAASAQDGIPAVGQQPGDVIAPSFYVTPSGKRLSAGQEAAGGVAAAAALPVYVMTPGKEGYLGDSHKCRGIGSHGGVNAIECADVYAVGGTASGKDVANIYAGGEGNCQIPGGNTQCPAVKFVAQAAQAPVPGVAYTTTAGTADCGGHSPKACNAGSNYFVETNDWFEISGCNIKPGYGYEFWTEVLPATIIALPGDINAQAAGNFGSAHVIVCSTPPS
jgi:hypothetical protein